MIWLIGCKGMLGTEIARQFKENNIEYTGTDIDVDITNPEALDKFASSLNNLQYIINCSAYTAVDKAESDIELATKLNVNGPENIAAVAKKYGAKMIHISTDYVFDGTGNTPRTEDMPVAPIGVYGVTKADGEKAVAATTKEYYILRTAWLYGWAGKNFVYTIHQLEPDFGWIIVYVKTYYSFTVLCINDAKKDSTRHRIIVFKLIFGCRLKIIKHY